MYNTLGYGFLDKTYENALAYEFEKIGLKFKKQALIRVLYEGKVTGEYFADFIFEDKVIVEIKALRYFSGS